MTHAARLMAAAVAITLCGLLALGVTGVGRVDAAGVPPKPTDTPAATATPYPTQTPAATYTPYPSPTVTRHPTLTLSSSEGMPGTRIIADAADFPANGTVTLYWDGHYLARDTADESGEVSFATAIPMDGAMGPHQLRAVGPSHTAAAALFTVAQTYHPTLTLDVTRGPSGTQVSLDAAGFVPYQQVHFYWDRVGGPDLGGGADESGNVGINATIGQGFAARVGAHRIYAVGTDPTLAVSTFFTVDPTPAACGGWDVPIPFTGKDFCIDPLGGFTSWLKGKARASADRMGAQFSDGLIQQIDYSTVPELSAAFSTTQDLARDLFGVLFLAGVLTWYVARLGLGGGAEAVLQVVVGGVGLALTESIPWLLGKYIAAVNGSADMILPDAAHAAAEAVAMLIARLADGELIKDVIGDPFFIGGAVGLFVFGFFIVLFLIKIVRIIGTVYGAVLYLASPLGVVCAASPLTFGVALTWARLWFSLTLWGVAYALAIVADTAMFAVFTRLRLYSGGIDALGEAFAGLLVIYGAPRLVDALLGGGATRALGIGHVPGLSTAIGVGIGAATGGAGSAVVNALRGAGATAGQGAVGGGEGATPAAPTVTEVGPSAPALPAPIEGEWGVLEEAGV